jgi:hypothetical protein
MSVWPNPCSGSLSIGALLPEGTEGTITVYDIAGRSVTSFEASAVNTVDVLESGLYFARLVTSSGESLSERFTVIR